MRYWWLVVIILCGCGPAREQKLSEFGQQFAHAINQNQPEKAVAELDFERYFARVTKDSRLSEPELAALKKRYGQAWRRGGGILESTRGEVWRLVKVELPNQLLFRVQRVDGTLDYRRALVSDTDEGPRIVDLYVFRSGAWQAETASQLLGVLGSDDSFEQRRLREILEQFYRLLQEGRYADVVAAYNELPAELREQKPVLIAYVTSASTLEPEVHQKAVERFASLFPEDPAVALLAYDEALARGRGEEALAAVEALRKQVGFDDAYLDYLRAECAALREQPDVVRTCLEKCVAAEPDTEFFHWALLERLEREGKFTEVSKRLAALETLYPDHAALVEAMEMMHRLEDFRASEAGVKWLSVQKKSPGEPG